jgi:16S rRNA (cytosine967-C5)-methyltransferase
LKYFRSRYSSALQLLEGYKYPEPFHIAAKNFFKGSKKFGSKDRKAIAEICYTYLRCGRVFEGIEIKKGLLLSSLFLEFDRVEDWNRLAEESKYDYTLPADFFYSGNSLDFVSEAVGKKISYFSEGILMEDFEHYNDAENVRFRPKNWAKDHTDKEVRKLGAVGVRELKLNEKLADTLQVQDLSSQFICTGIDLNEGDKIWDVCSGAGGKSLNLSAQGNGTFFLSDIRPAIIQNAKSRFASMYYKANFGIADMQKEASQLKFGANTVDGEYFDTIVADVPCSGSGTWFRTPEHFTRFDYTEIESYATRQQTIVKNAVPFLKKGGSLYYITCSVFAQENTEVRDWITANTDLKFVEEIAFDGLRQRADGMYMATFEK